MRLNLQAIGCIVFLCLASVCSAKHLRLYACTLANDDPAAFMAGSSLGAGLWVSDDSASTWKQIGWKHVKCYSIAIDDSSNGQLLYLACGNGLLRSSDAGEHWRMLTDWRITEVMDVLIDKAHRNTIIITTATGLWKSMDAGEHWVEVGPRTYCSQLHYDAVTKQIVGGPRVFHLSDSFTYSINDAGAIALNGKQIVRAVSKRGGLWSLVSAGQRLFIGGERGLYECDTAYHLLRMSNAPKNIHSMVTIGTRIFLASLTSGIWTTVASQQEPDFARSGLETLQVWSIHSKEIE